MTFFNIFIEPNKKTVLDLLLWWISLTFLWLFCAALSPVLWDAPNKIRYFLPYHLPVSKYNTKKYIIGDVPRRKYTIFLYWNVFLNWFNKCQQCYLISTTLQHKYNSGNQLTWMSHFLQLKYGMGFLKNSMSTSSINTVYPSCKASRIICVFMCVFWTNALLP